MGWIRIKRDQWEQYVGRRIVKFYVNGLERVYLAYAGQTFCGSHATLDQAKAAAEQA